MSRFNPNLPTDFLQMTVGTATEILAAFQRNRNKWDIVEASYQGPDVLDFPVPFHIFQSLTDYQAALPRINDRGGRRKSRIRLPYVDGQTTEDLGRKEQEFDLEIIFFGPRYKVGLDRLLRALNRPEPGFLMHPVMGSINCGMESYELEHSSQMQNAVLMRLHLIEHAFDIGSITLPPLSVKGFISKALALLSKIAKVIQTIRAVVNMAISIKNFIIEKVKQFQALVTAVISSLNAVFNPSSQGDIPGALPVNEGGLLTPAPRQTQLLATQNSTSTARTAGVGSTSITTTGGYFRVGDRFTTVVAPVDPFANLPLGLLNQQARQAIAVQQLTQQVDVVRQQANEIVSDINTAPNGAISLSDAVLDITEMAVTCQELLQAGMRNTRSRVITYTVPRVMSIREAAFLNGLTAEDGGMLEIMNPGLDSANFLAKGTVLKIPVAR